MSLQYYESIKQLPIKNFDKMQNLFLINNGIGANITDFDNKLENLVLFIKTNKTEKALNEVSNMRFLFDNIQNKRNPLHYAFLQTLKKKLKTKINFLKTLEFLTKKQSKS